MKYIKTFENFVNESIINEDDTPDKLKEKLKSIDIEISKYSAKLYLTRAVFAFKKSQENAYYNDSDIFSDIEDDIEMTIEDIEAKITAIEIDTTDAEKWKEYNTIATKVCKMYINAYKIATTGNVNKLISFAPTIIQYVKKLQEVRLKHNLKGKFNPYG